MNFEEYLKQIFDFDFLDAKAKEAFDERLGSPTERDAAIGLITIAFNQLENRVSEGIAELLGASEQIGQIVTSELSFNAKVNLFSSLVKELRPTHNFNRFENDTQGYDGERYFRELIKALTKCEELRNQVIHSTYSWDITEGRARIMRRKVTAKAKRGLNIKSEIIDIAHLLNVYDFTVSMEMEVDEFFIDFRKRD